MDLSRVSTEDLMAFREGRLKDVTTEGLLSIKGITPKEPGLFERISSDVGQRAQNIEKIKQKQSAGTIGPIRSGVRQAGQAAWGYSDVAGEIMSELTPDFIKEPAKKIAGKVIETAGKLPAFGGGTIGEKLPQEFSMLKEKYPEAMEDAEAALGIGLLATPIAKKPNIKTGQTVVGDLGDKVIKAGEKQSARLRKEYIDDLVLPKQTAAVKTEQVGRTVEKGLLKKKSVTLSPRELEIADEIGKIRQVNRKNTLQSNYSLIQREATREANRLKTRLASNDVFFPKKEIKSALKKAAQNLDESPLITGDAAVSAKKILLKMDKLIDEMPRSSASNLLEARKKLDQWAKQQKGNNILDPSGRETAMSLALREIRTATNDFIDTKATNVPVKKSLRKQSNLYTAMENIAPKAADEADNAIARLVQNTIKHVPLKNELYQMIGATAGAAGATAVAGAFPKAVMAGAGLYGIGRAAISPTTKKALGQLLRATDKTIRFTKDKELIKTLRADRAFLVEILKNAPSASEPGQQTSTPQNRQEKQQ